MKEMSRQQETQARKTSKQWARVWEIYTNPSRATTEEMLWATQFFKDNHQNFKDLIAFSSDPEEQAQLELIYLGLYHAGYKLPLEHKFKAYSQN